MDSLSPWLQELGLERYAAVFAENDVDLEALRLLTEADLERLGLSLGHRRKLLRAIAELNGQLAPAPTSPRIRESSSPQESVSPEAERRQLTIMFCDLVGSTALSHALDPEQLRELMRAYQRACGQVIETYGGHVAQYLGDGLMVYFGWPRAHEDDAERAVRASLDIVDAVKSVPAGAPLQVRVGIATGPVVVGETGAGDASVPKVAVGETPNLAARLQGLAGPDEIVVGLSTQRLLGASFEYRDLGQHMLKGVVEPARAWRVLGVASVEGRFEATREAAALTPLVGREEEIRLLLRRWEQTKAGEGQAVLLCGEPGVGKSRILQVLRERVAQEPHTRLRYQCSPFHSDSAFHPIIEQFEHGAGFSRDDSPDEKLDKMEALLGAAGNNVQGAAPLFAAMLSLSLDRYPVVRLSPQQRKDSTIEAQVAQVLGLARTQPVLLLFEDAHWADPTTLETLDRLVNRIESACVLIVVTYRPEFLPAWIGQPRVTALTLARLSRREAATLAEKVTGGKGLPPEVLDQIVAKTDGVPLFVEELTKAVLESGLLRDCEDRYELDGPLPPLAIPSTLQDSLMARLDRLAPVKEIAQIGAVLGREFSYELLAAVSPVQEPALGDALSRLVASELVSQRGVPPEALYLFKHALVQDTAYESLLRSKRQALHAKIANVLEERFPGKRETEPEILGLHYERAGLGEKAGEWYLKSGQQAKARSAYREAIRSFERSVALLGHVADMAKRASIEIEIRSHLGMLYLMLEGFSSAIARTHFTRAHELGIDASHDQRFPALVGLVEILSWDVSKTEARSLGDDLLRLAATTGDRVHSLYAHQVRGRSSMYMGRFRDALAESKQVIEIYEEHRDMPLAFEYGYDPGVFALSSLAYSHMVLGFLERAAQYTDECIALARRIGHPYTLSFALAIPGADIWHLMRDPAKALQFAREGQEVSGRWGFGYLKAMCDVHAGWATAMQGRYADGLECMTNALDAIRNMGVWAAVTPRMIAQLASVYAAGGRADEGLSVLESSPDRQPGRRRVRHAGISRIEGDLHRLKSSPDLGLAEACYREAIQIAIEDEAKPFELCAATSLARLWMEQGKSRQAHELLAPLLAWFTEGHDFRDLREAKAVLDELNACQTP